MLSTLYKSFIVKHFACDDSKSHEAPEQHDGISTDSSGKLGNCAGRVSGEEAVVTSEAVMKKFHGSSVPRPRMKKQIATK